MIKQQMRKEYNKNIYEIHINPFKNPSVADGASTDAITNHLFTHQTAPDEGFDLIALNIQASMKLGKF